MLLSVQGYYAILDVKGTSASLDSSVRRATMLLEAEPCCLQIRGKELAPAALCALGHALRPLCSQRHIPLCINDRLEVALAVGADVIHLGQDDLPLAEALRARDVAAPGRLRVGVSTHDLAQAMAAEAGGADYIGFGPVFSTRTKPQATSAVGLPALREVVKAVALPVVAIGGINLDRVAEVARTGAAAAAVIAAVDEAVDPIRAGLCVAHAFRREQTPIP